MKKVIPVTVRLSEYQVRQLDSLAKARETTRSEVARRLIDNELLSGGHVVNVSLDDDTYKKVSTIARTCKVDVDMALASMIDFLTAQTFMSYLMKGEK